MSATVTKIAVEIPPKFTFLLEPARYKVAYGGRYGVKSWSFARALLMIGLDPSLLWPGRKSGVRILCARETQKSIEESVHYLLESQIARLDLQDKYDVKQHSITAANGTEFAFVGIRQNVSNLKSYEDFDICWVSEAAMVSKNSWRVLIPTIRKNDSEIWVDFNPELETDDTYQRFVVNPPSDAKVVHTTWKDNPWLSNVIVKEMRDLKAKDEAEYNHVYGGLCKQSVDGAIYRQELAVTDTEYRITRVPYDSQHPVHTFWDLGYGDNTSIWFAQSLPFEFRLIDYLSGSLQALGHYVKELKERPYAYGLHYLPHDAKAHELGSGRTIEEQLKEHMGRDRVKVCKRVGLKKDGIEAVRAIFGRCWFDKEKCADGIQALRHYRYEMDEEHKTFRREPLHDWASHGADAFQTFALSIKELQRPQPRKSEDESTPRVATGDGGWMA
jgi:phage terminase large subunit